MVGEGFLGMSGRSRHRPDTYPTKDALMGGFELEAGEEDMIQIVSLGDAWEET